MLYHLRASRDHHEPCRQVQEDQDLALLHGFLCEGVQKPKTKVGLRLVGRLEKGDDKQMQFEYCTAPLYFNALQKGYLRQLR